MNKRKELELERLRAFNEDRESGEQARYPSEAPLPPKLTRKSFVLEGVLDLQKTDPKICVNEGPCSRRKDIAGVIDKGDGNFYNLEGLMEVLWTLNGKAVRIKIEFAVEE